MSSDNISFSQKYKTSRKISSFSKSDSDIEQHIVRWSKSVVDFFYAKNERASFEVRININPNPLDCKGVDQIRVEVWQTDDGQDIKYNNAFQFKPFIKLMSDRHYTMSACIEDINAKIDALMEISKPLDVVEINGKKYKLTPID